MLGKNVIFWYDMVWWVIRPCKSSCHVMASLGETQDWIPFKIGNREDVVGMGQ